MLIRYPSYFLLYHLLFQVPKGLHTVNSTSQYVTTGVQLVKDLYMFSQSSIIFFSSCARPDAEFGLADEAVKGTVAPPRRE